MKKENCYVSAWNQVEINGKIWMPLTYMNGLCAVDSSSDRACVKHVFEEYPYGLTGLFYNIIHMGNNLILIPGVANYIGIYDIERETFDKCPLDMSVFDDSHINLGLSKDNVKFWSGAVWANNLYLIPVSFPAIVRMDLSARHMEYVVDWIQEVKHKFPVLSSQLYFAEGCIVHDGFLYAVMSCCACLIKVNMPAGDVEVIDLSGQIQAEGFDGIAIKGNKFWLLARDKSSSFLVEFDSKRRTVLRRIDIPDAEIPDTIPRYHAPVITGKCMYLFPVFGDTVYFVDLDKETIGVHDKLSALMRKPKGDEYDYQTSAIAQKNDILKFLTWADQQWHEYNMKTDEVKSYSIILDDKEYIEKYNVDVIEEGLRDNSSILYERQGLLETFIDYVGRNR